MTAEIASSALGSAIGKLPLKAAARRPKARAGKVRRKASPKVIRTSEILRGLLKSKERKFTVKQILGALGTQSFGTSLMAFSIPEVLPIPVPGISAVVVVPTGIISAQMAMGRREITLPKWLLKRSVPRKPLAAAIHSILPVLERLERVVRPRWKWMTSAAAKRFLGAFILLLAGLIALPIPGTNMPLAIAIFVIALGLVERDGAMIAAGILIGLASIALLGGIFAGLLALFNNFFV